MSAAQPLGVRAALRSAPGAECAAESVVVGEIDGKTDWSQALAGIDYIVHLAARVHVMNPTAADRIEFERTNVVGTEHLANAAVTAGVRQFIFLSSVKVNGDMTVDRAFRADDAPQPSDDYGRSKLEAERRLLRIDAESGMRVAIIRPPLVYGPGVRANFLRLLSIANRAVPLPLEAVKNVRSMVSVWNLCDLICVLLRRADAIGGIYMVSDGEDISTPELIRRLAASMGRPVRLFSLPDGLLRNLAKVTGHSAEFNRLCASLAVDIADTRSRLEWSPPIALALGLDRTARWYLRQKDAESQAKNQ
jgi:UDP-glucose 4-epimerase